MQPSTMDFLVEIFQKEKPPQELINKIDAINAINVSVGLPKLGKSAISIISADYFEYDPKTKQAKPKEQAKPKAEEGYVHNLTSASKVGK